MPVVNCAEVQVQTRHQRGLLWNQNQMVMVTCPVYLELASLGRAQLVWPHLHVQPQELSLCHPTGHEASKPEVLTYETRLQ